MDLMCQNICSADWLQSVLILLTIIKLNFCHSAFDHCHHNFVLITLYLSKSVKKGAEVLSLCPLCQQCFFFILNPFILLEENKQHLYLLNICLLYPL